MSANPERDAAIVAAAAAGETALSIAARFGIKPSRVHQILRVAKFTAQHQGAAQ